MPNTKPPVTAYIDIPQPCADARVAGSNQINGKEIAVIQRMVFTKLRSM